MKLKWIVFKFIVLYGAAVIIGVMIARYVKDPEKTFVPLEVGKCYRANDYDGLEENAYIHKVLKRGEKKDYYLAEQWDKLKGWYGNSVVRRFDADVYKQIPCPPLNVYKYNEEDYDTEE